MTNKGRATVNAPNSGNRRSTLALRKTTHQVTTRKKEQQLATLRDALRNWANGIYPLEAGIELLIQQGKAIREDAPWIIEEHDQAPERPRIASIDTTKLQRESGTWSGGEQRVTRIAVSLLGGEPVNMNDALPGLDREHLTMVLAAIAHAGGSHEHSRMKFSADGLPAGFETLPSLHAWPTRTQPAYEVPVDPIDGLHCDSCQ